MSKRKTEKAGWFSELEPGKRIDCMNEMLDVFRLQDRAMWEIIGERYGAEELQALLTAKNELIAKWLKEHDEETN